MISAVRRLAAFLILVFAAAPVGAAELPISWVQYAADGMLSVRTITAPGAECPAVSADGAPVTAVVRSDPGVAFPVRVCEARAPAGAARLAVGGAAAPTLPGPVRRIAVIGDSGCRLEGRAVQDCNEAKAWPFAGIAQRAAARRPDLVIHLGDYYYRESACPVGRAGCAGSPFGDNWASWKAEVFDPAAPLLAAAPWVVVRGNHELCRRGGQGWFRLLDPYPARADCVDRTAPYRLSAGGLDLLMFDNSDADDFLAPPDKVEFYAAQFASLLANAPQRSWLVLHRPVWAMAQGELNGLTANLTMQGAIRDKIPAGLDLVLAGHLHDLIAYDFGAERPSQLIVGTGGDNLLPLGRAPIVGAEIDGLPVRQGMALARFGYLMLERAGEGWDGVFYAPDDTVLARCRLSGRSLACS